MKARFYGAEVQFRPLVPDDQPRKLVRLLVDGLQIDAESREGGVIDLAVRADQHHKGTWGRLRQHLANALFRAGRLCNPGNHNRPVRVVEILVPQASLKDEHAWLRQCQVFQRWPVDLANGDADYELLVAHEGVESHHQRMLAFKQFFRGGRQERADDAHRSTPSEEPMVRRDGTHDVRASDVLAWACALVLGLILSEIWPWGFAS